MHINSGCLNVTVRAVNAFHIRGPGFDRLVDRAYSPGCFTSIADICSMN